MTGGRTAALSAAPIVLSAGALALVLATAGGLTGTYPARDEGWQAQVFQVLIPIQLPLIVLNVVARGRRRPIVAVAGGALHRRDLLDRARRLVNRGVLTEGEVLAGCSCEASQSPVETPAPLDQVADQAGGGHGRQAEWADD